MSQNNLPDLSKLSHKVALNNVRVHKFLDGLSSKIDAMLEAAKEKNWPEVTRLGHFVYRCSEVYGYDELAEKADSVCTATSNLMSDKEIGKRIIRLVGAYARSSNKRTEIMANQS